LCSDELLTAEPPSTSIVDDANRERLVKVARMTEIEDLQAPQSLPYAPLCIKVKLVLMA
jgi:transcription initiation factor TFIIH subunit 1